MFLIQKKHFKNKERIKNIEDVGCKKKTFCICLFVCMKEVKRKERESERVQESESEK